MNYKLTVKAYVPLKEHRKELERINELQLILGSQCKKKWYIGRGRGAEIYFSECVIDIEPEQETLYALEKI